MGASPRGMRRALGLLAALALALGPLGACRTRREPSPAPSGESTVSLLAGGPEKRPGGEDVPPLEDETGAVPRRRTVGEQYHHAMSQCYIPASRAKGAARKELCRKAVLAFQAVWEYFPKTPRRNYLMAAHLYQGACYLELGERRKAADAFLVTLRWPRPAEIRHRGHATVVGYHRTAHRHLMTLLDVLTPEEQEEVNREA